MGFLILLFMFALALIVGPVAANVMDRHLGALTSTIMTASGIALAVMAGTLMIITRLYVKTKASEAFVRTGMGGMRVIKDGGAIVIPVIHQIVKISLQTLRLDVGREGPDALITKDKLRADIKAEFFVRVMPDDDSIKNAARSFGEHMDDERYVSKLVEDKLISALRTIAATKTLEELNTQRDEFVKQVTDIVTPDLAHNGLTLEVATISRLDQTALQNLRDDNVFDAQGKRTIAAITQEQATARNELERAGEQARKRKDVETRQAMLSLERQQAEAEAEQSAQIAVIRAQKMREAQEKEIEAARAVEIAGVQKAQAVEVAQRQQQQAVETAERKKLEAITQADREVEVAKRKQQEAIAHAERERASAEAELAKAEAQRETERQAIITVQVRSEAERAKTTQVIGAQAEAERKFTEAQRAADAEAYRLQKEAEGKKAAADAEAEAVTKKAQAEASAKKAHAEGDKALQMVPVEVAKEQVGVKQREVEVLQQELEARAEHGAAAQQFEIEKLRITKEAEVRIAGAQAMATFGGKIEATVVGTPEDVSRMTQAYMKGMGVSRTIDGFFSAAGPETVESLDGVGQALASLVAAATRRGDNSGPDSKK
ncbi:MAG TPA: SPFH domain-containing protein [Kofleriaceae bacterium]|nr:SPFH domain-containing protein [Kofleriaceae bacterium]